MKLKRLLTTVGVVCVSSCCMLVLLAGAARAAPIVGNATLAFLPGLGQPNATLSGNFIYDPGTGGIVSWNFTSTAFGRIYSSSSTDAPTSLVLSNSNGNEVFSFEQNFPGS